MRLTFAVIVTAMLSGNALAVEYMKDYSTHAQKVLETDAGELELLSNIILSNAYAQMDAAASTGNLGEVSQAAERANLKLLDLVVKQNDEIIRLLRSLAAPKEAVPAAPAK